MRVICVFVWQKYFNMSQLQNWEINQTFGNKAILANQYTLYIIIHIYVECSKYAAQQNYHSKCENENALGINVHSAYRMQYNIVRISNHKLVFIGI